MNYDELQNVEEQVESAEAGSEERQQRVAPGKRTLTMNLPTLPVQTRKPVQQKQRAASAPARQAGAGDRALTSQWLDTAMRPDLHAPPVQRKAQGETTDEAAPSASGSGQAMPAPVQAKMESAFQTDFSDVRIHEGPEAPAIGAMAYTQGTDIHFAPGQYSPGSQGGQELLGHELTHVVQQARGTVQATTQAKGVAVNDNPALEREADEMGKRAARGDAVSESLAGPDVASAQAGAGTGALAKLAPVQRATGPIQMTQYKNPSDPAIQAAMTTAGIASFGPYVWDDTNSKAPMFKLDPGYNAWTLADCVNRPVYEPEDPSKVVAGEKGKQALVQQRIKAARKAVFGSAQGIVDKIMAHDDGKTPRAFTSLSDEDTKSGGHTVERHILGQGEMKGHREVALRAAFWKVNGKKMDLDAAGTATVFASDGVASAAVQAAITNELAANWAAHRVTLAKNTQVKITYPVAVNVVAYTKHDAPLGAPYPDTDMPKYLDSSKSGDRELYSGDYTGPGKPTDANAPDTAKNPLTTGGGKALANVYIIVDPNPGVDGGWAIYTAYPK